MTIPIHMPIEHPKRLALFLLGNQAYGVSHPPTITASIGYCPRSGYMECGWLLGEEHIANRAPVIRVEGEKDEIILIPSL